MPMSCLDHRGRELIKQLTSGYMPMDVYRKAFDVEYLSCNFNKIDGTRRIDPIVTAPDR